MIDEASRIDEADFLMVIRHHSPRAVCLRTLYIVLVAHIARAHDHITELAARARKDNPEVRRLIRSIKHHGTAPIKYKGEIHKQPHVSFGQAGTLPSLVCEIS